MDRVLLWWGIALLLGPAAGVMVARAAREMPRNAGIADGALPYRLLIALVGCTVVSLWSIGASPGAPALVTALLGWLLVLLALLDAEHFWLPHRLTVPLGLLGLAQAAAFEPNDLVNRLIGIAVGFGALWGLAWAYRRYRGREGLGGGDFRLLGAAGAWVGWLGLPSVLVIGSLSGLLVVGLTALGERRLSLTQQAPFGVFLSLGLWLTWLYGPFGRPDL